MHLTNLTILIVGRDHFSDLWIAQNKLIKKYLNCTLPIFITTNSNSKGYKFDDVSIDVYDESSSVLYCIQHTLNKIKTKYVLLILGDYLLCKPANVESIVKDLKLMEANHIDYLRVFNIPLPLKQDKKNKIGNIYKLTNSRIYNINMGPSIWERNILMSSIVDNTITTFDYEVSLAAFCVNHNLLCYATITDEYPATDCVRKGKFLRKSARWLKKNNLWTSNMVMHSRKDNFKYSLATFINRHFPTKLKTLIKNRMRKHGHKFYSDASTLK